MVFCTSSSPPKPPMLTPPPDLIEAVEVSNCCVARFSCSMESRTNPRARRRSWIELSAGLHARRLLLQFADGADRRVVFHEPTGEVPGRRQNADQERQGQDAHRHPHGASALHA
jgi:hypothetical protein